MKTAIRTPFYTICFKECILFIVNLPRYDYKSLLYLSVYAQLIGTEALNQHLPAGLYLKVDDKDIPAVVQKIKQFYFGKDEITNTKEDLDTFEKVRNIRNCCTNRF